VQPGHRLTLAFPPAEPTPEHELMLQLSNPVNANNLLIAVASVVNKEKDIISRQGTILNRAFHF
jgi:hypothetical protein